MGQVECMRGKRNTHRDLVVNPKGKIQLGKSSHRWKDNTELDFTEIRREDMDFIQLAQAWDELWVHIHVVMNLWIP
jgi:hypothetical protein